MLYCNIKYLESFFFFPQKTSKRHLPNYQNFYSNFTIVRGIFIKKTKISQNNNNNKKIPKPLQTAKENGHYLITGIPTVTSLADPTWFSVTPSRAVPFFAHRSLAEYAQ